MTRFQQMLSRFYELAQPVPEFMNYLRKHQIDLAEVGTSVGIFGVALCRSFEYPDGSLGFEFSRHGIPHAVIEALYFRQMDGVRETYPADLVAWPLNDRFSFATALGPHEGAELLGPLSAVQRGGHPLRIFRTPLNWMKNGCEGSVLLKHGAVYWLNKAGGPFIAEDFEHAVELRELVGHKHQILVPSFKRIAACTLLIIPPKATSKSRPK